MKPHKHCELIKAWADGAEVEYLFGDEWVKLASPTWDTPGEYRIHDPYRELKEAAKDPTKQIRINGGVDWVDAGEFNWTWTASPSDYEIRDKPVEKKKVKLWAWLGDGELRWFSEDSNLNRQVWKRVPSEDKEIEV